MSYMRISRLLALSSALSGAAFCQTAPAATAPAFEVAAIKPSEPITASGGKVMIRIGVNNDGRMVTYSRMTLKALVQNAYRVKDFQVTGPSWADAQQWDISAKLPDGASKDDAPDMLKTLLEERFKLKVHVEKKEHPVYALIVGKGGAKLKPAEITDDPPRSESGPALPPPPPPKALAEAGGGGRGAIVAPPGAFTMRMGENGGHMESRAITLSRFSDMISRYLDRPVVDETGIGGKYDFAIDISREQMVNMKTGGGMLMMGLQAAQAGGGGPAAGPGSGGPELPNAPEGGSLFQSIQQYGLKLEPKKAPMDIITIDSAEKAPSEN
jgi:uncharacterized protein (TIGR03435 family)